jgi:HK97 family phage prohead protease
VPFKINHDGMTLARTKSGTMKLAEDAHGLHVEAQLDPRNSEVQNLRSAMERGDIDEMSFAFRATDDTWSEDWTQRAIRGADIHKGDVSAVNYGASPHTAGAKLRTADMVRALRSIQPAELDDDTREALLHVLQLVAAADGAVDVAQPKLAAILGVPNPDIDAASADQIAEKKSLTSLYALRARLLSL